MSSNAGNDDSDAGSVIDMSVVESSAASVYSFSSSRDGSAMLREVAGRIFNSQNELYYLPADDVEYSRQDIQHLVQVLSNDGLVAREAADGVRAVLDPSNPTPDGTPKRVLDLGCGGGIWAISMAMQYPHAEVVGVDLAPNTTRAPPPNCRFEFDDFNLGLSHYHGMFDVVHARSCCNGVTSFQELINDMAMCLRPGGYLLMVEGDMLLASHRRELQETANGDGNPSKSWFARILFEAFSSAKARGAQVDAHDKLHGWICENQLVEDACWAKHFIPIGPWERGRTAFETRKMEVIGELMRQNSLAFARAFKPLLLSEGYSSETIDRFIAGADKELNELSVHMYAPWYYFWAVRKASTDSALIGSNAQSTPAATGPETEPPIGSNPVSLHAPATSPSQNITVRSVAPSTDSETYRHERLANVGLWVEGSVNSSMTSLSDLSSGHDSDVECVDAGSDEDMDVESVSDM
ncbi:S-adenosyl-L-methionine-dependent methyltransferase [Ceratobasidium sp. AG-I]|nr:S-adenosyl-L-methionine-dependent methyltransferase [Ceratobasidium sp. AG-I]